MNRDGSHDGSHDASVQRDPIEGFAELLRHVPGPLPARQRMAGWQRLQQAIAARQPLRDDAARSERGPSWLSVWLSSWRVRTAVVLALSAIAIPVGWRIGKRAEPRSLEYVVSGEDGLDVLPATGRVLSSRTGRAQLLFTDGSQIGLHRAARLTVASLTARGSDIRLLDGQVDVEVRHQPDTAWTFQAGPYTVRVKGTAFELGWDAAQKHLTLRMRTGVVALARPGSGPALVVTGGESVLLDELGNSLAPPAGAQLPPPTARSGGSMPAAGGDAGGPLHLDRNGKASDRRRVRPSAVHAEWGALLARGAFEEIVDQANRTRASLDACLGSDTEQNLAALADAARYTHRSELARRALQALRARFPSTNRARDAAFFLARLSESSGGGAREAVGWYERYLEEAPGGSYAEEALGREMILFGRTTDLHARARAVAGRYLRDYPHGLYTNEATSLLGNPAVP